MNNIFEKHISNIQKKFRKYNSLILKSKYNKEYSDELIKTYIEARYYNYNVNQSIRVFYRRINDALKNKSNVLIKNNPREKEQILDTLSLFNYYFYFDNVRDNLEIEDVIEKIEEKRINEFNLRSAQTDNFKEEFTNLINSDIKEFEENLEMYDSDDWFLEIKKITPKNKNYFKVKLNYTFDFPEIFSEEIIDVVFNSEITKEDKLFVEYPMITNIALKDVIGGNFGKVYVCEFAPELLNKKKKLEQLLEILNNPAAQEKIMLEVDYDDFKKYKKDIFKLINNGFKFALKTNDNMPKLSKEEIKILEVFDLIIVSTKDINKNDYTNTKIL